MSVGFKIFKKNAKKWTAVEKGPSSFQNFHLNLDKRNKDTAEFLKNETVKCYSQCTLDFTHIKTTNKIKSSNFNRNQGRATARRTLSYKNAPLVKKCFACDKKTKQKKRSRHLEMLSRVEWDDALATLIDATKKNENLLD